MQYHGVDVYLHIVMIQTLSHPCTCTVHLLVLCIVHLTCGFRHRLKLTSEISDYLVICEGHGTMCSESSLISVWENVSMSSTTLLFAEGGHQRFIFDWSCAVHIIQYLPYVFVSLSLILTLDGISCIML